MEKSFTLWVKCGNPEEKVYFSPLLALSQNWACICLSFRFRELQRHRETIIQKLAVQKQQEISNEEEIIAKAVAEREARQAREQREKEEQHAAMLKSIAAHRESMVNELILLFLCI